MSAHAKGVPGWVSSVEKTLPEDVDTTSNWKDETWMHEWIMQYIEGFEEAVQGCVSRAGRAPTLAWNLCCVASLSKNELQHDLREVEWWLDPRRSGKRLSRTTTDYYLIRQKIIKQELRHKAEESTRPVFRRRQDPVYLILHIFSLLHEPVKLTRAQTGECLRELHRLMKVVIVPLDPDNHQLTPSLATFELLVRNYPDNPQDPKMVDHLMKVYYVYHLQKGNYRLCFDVALQAAQRYRRFSKANQSFLPSLADALDKAASCAEFLHEHETARPLLQEAIGIYKKLVDADPRGKQVQTQGVKILLARTLVRYSRAVCRLGHDLAAHWERDALESLREAIKIYTMARSFNQSGPARYGEELEDALWDLAVMAMRRKDKEEFAEMELRLKRLHA
ncbi:hypothetical protein FRC01_006395 [Tulasnella sp. 417]|nr:hypothetical protein FRC01_006395 [Tulasnella sp. 417]